jgi:hypothetical protein
MTDSVLRRSSEATIHAICTWCVSSAIIFTLLAIVGGPRVLRVEPQEPAAAVS